MLNRFRLRQASPKCTSTLNSCVRISPASVDSLSRAARVASLSTRRSFKKILAANRGEIAIRIMRAGAECNIRTTGIYSYEDRYCPHRYKADESYLVGKGKTAVGAYLDYNGIIAVAKANGVDSIHPGYGFLSENADFADACSAAGITFVGPSADVLRKFGSKTEARAVAIANGVPVVPGSDGPVPDVAAAIAFATKVGFPLIVKAAFGGGGRGMRVVKSMSELHDAFTRAQSEALAAFGNGTVFLERFVERPRHIEVQVLGDSYGNVIHLFERDCSVQRRHQKVVEYAPALELPPLTREALLRDAVRLAKAVGYTNAGTVEFLVDTADGKYYFMEVNPRVQVEHTVTEEVTDVDIVQSQIRIAEGWSLNDLGLSQETVRTNGFAIQCRITTEDAAANFQPDTGIISVYRSAHGHGIRLDEGPGYVGANISPHYDSLLVKVTARDLTFEGARAKLRRALREHRIRGVTTNIPFLVNVLDHPEFIEGKVTTRFIEENPELVRGLVGRKNRGEKLLRHLAEVAVNGHPKELGATGPKPELLDPKAPSMPLPATPGRKQAVPKLKAIFDAQGPSAFAKAVRDHKGVLVMDTTWRDAHQSLLATRLRTIDIMPIAPATRVALANAYSIENWGGATFDVCMRFLKECPWDRLQEMREAVPDIPFQMLLRGANAVGYTSYPDNAVFKFCQVAKDKGMDVFRVFDSLNYIENMKLGIDAVGAAGGIIEASICYSGDLMDPSKSKYTLDYYLNFARQLVERGAHVLAVKDMAGLLKPGAARILIGALRAEFPHIPIHVHTHDTAGTGVAAMIACAEAGADAVDVAIDSMSGSTSQPSMGALVGALAGTPLDTGIDPLSLGPINDYWEDLRGVYAPFESGQKTGSADVFVHEMPGGQYTNLLFQSKQLGLTGQWPAIKLAYAAANRLLGNIIKVTPSSKVVGDLAQFMVTNGLSEADVRAQASTLHFPSSVVQYFQGYLGIPYQGFPELRKDVLKDRTLPNGLSCFAGRPGEELEPVDFTEQRKVMFEQFGLSSDTALMSYLMYPTEFKQWQSFLQTYGEVDSIPTRNYLTPMQPGHEFSMDVEKGKTLIVKLKSIGEMDGASMRDVQFLLNGEPRTIRVADRTTVASKGGARAGGSGVRAKADKTVANEIGAPMMGVVVDVRVSVGSKVKVGQPLVVLSAMKMETVVGSAVNGTVKSLFVKKDESVEAGDLIIEIEPST